MHARANPLGPPLVLAFVLAGCGSNSSPGSANAAPPATTPDASGSQASSSGGTTPADDDASGAGSGATGPSATPDASGGGSSQGPGSSSGGASTDASSPAADATMGSAPDSSADAGAPYDAGPPAVRFVARVDYTQANPRFAWSGSTVLARFMGSSIGVRMSGTATTYFDVSIDGVMQTSPLIISPNPPAQGYPLATGLDGGVHDLTVFRRNEPMLGGDTTFLGLILDDAGALLPPAEPPSRRLEIIGDSVTAAFGDDSVNGACPNSTEAQNYDQSYGAVAARTVGADLITTAWTAKGMYRNHDNTTTDTMPILYGRTLPDTQTTDTWNFASWIPDAVVIYLGNNDFGMGDPGPMYVTTYNTFIARIRTNYPNALIICTIGPNLTDPDLSEERTYVNSVVSTQNTAGDMNVVFLEMPQPTAAEGTGCGGHPLAATHARMGAALVTLLQSKLGW